MPKGTFNTVFSFPTDLLSISDLTIVDILCSRNPVIIGRKQSIDWSDLAKNLLAWLFFSPSLGPQHPATMLVLLCEAMRCGYLGQDSMHTKLPEILLAIRSIPTPDSPDIRLEESVDLARLIATPTTPGSRIYVVVFY